MSKKILFSIIISLIAPLFVSAAENTSPEIHPCLQAWNDKMHEYDQEYEEGLQNLLFQKQRTSQIISSEAISYNLRSHNCKMHQICEVVHKSLSPEQIKEEGDNMVTGVPLRCQPKAMSEFGGLFESCSNANLKFQFDTAQLWSQCAEQATERIENIELITETEIKKSSEAKKSSNFVGYLIEFNKKLEKLTMDFGDMIGALFAVTREMACTQKTCQ